LIFEHAHLKKNIFFWNHKKIIFLKTLCTYLFLVNIVNNREKKIVKEIVKVGFKKVHECYYTMHPQATSPQCNAGLAGFGNPKNLAACFLYIYRT